MTADLREASADALPFADASFDTAVCTVSLCNIPDDQAAIAEMYRVLRPSGRLILLDHVASDRPWVLAIERVLELLTLRMNSDYLTRRPLPLVAAAGFTIERSERLKVGIIERLTAAAAPAPFPAGSSHETVRTIKFFSSENTRGVSARRTAGRRSLSGLDEPGDRVGRLADLGGRDVAALDRRLGDAVRQVVFQQAQRHRLQRPRRRRHLGQDVDAVLVVLDHLLQAADLALDPAQPLEVPVLARGVSVHAAPSAARSRDRAATVPYPRVV
jgi:hypothetical protein